MDNHGFCVCVWLQERTALHWASQSDQPRAAQLLLEHGAWVNDRGGKLCEGVTPLHDAACCGHVDVVASLLRAGANPLVSYEPTGTQRNVRKTFG